MCKDGMERSMFCCHQLYRVMPPPAPSPKTKTNKQQRKMKQKETKKNNKKTHAPAFFLLAFSKKISSDFRML